MFGTVVFIVFVIVGSAAIFFGRTLPTPASDEAKERWGRWLSGPSGHYRTSTIFLGCVLIFIGIMGVVVDILAL